MNVLDYRYLKAFILTAKYASFSKAAIELNIAQSAVSRQIKLLEDTLGEELIIRSSKKVMLSEKGAELLQTLINFEKATLSIFETEDKKGISVGILEGLLHTWFTPILAQYLSTEERKVSVTTADIPELRSGVENGKFDIIFSTENIQSELVSSLKLFEEKLVLICKKEINRKKLQDYRWIVFSENDYLYKISKIRSEQIVTIDSFESIIELVKKDIGIAIVPDHLVKVTDNLTTHEIPSLPSSQIYMGTLNFKKMPERIKKMATLVTKKN